MITQKIFTYPFEDKRWGSKFLIGSLLFMASYVVPILPLFFVLGYAVEAMRIIIERGRAEMPEWDNWGRLGLKGVYWFIVNIVYLIPALVACLGGASLLLMGTSLTSAGFAATEKGSELSGLAIGLGTLIIVAAFLFFLLGLVLLLAASLFAPMAVAHYVARGRLGAAFRPGEIWALICANPGDFILAWLVVYGLAYVLTMVTTFLYSTVCLCLFVPIITAPLYFYMILLQMSLFGAVYHETSAKLWVERPPTPAPPVAPPEVVEKVEAEEEIEEVEEAAPPVPVEEKVEEPVSIDDLDLPKRISNALKEAGISTVHELQVMSDEELLAIKGIGPKTLAQLKDRLE
jgi:hypothetical protein